MSESTAAPTWPAVLTTLLSGSDLPAADAEWAMHEVMTGTATPVQIASFLVALRAKGETSSELRGLADGMLAHAVRIEVPGRTLDIVGTGGDQAHTVNISTMSAIVAAGAGAHVVKHGNRAASSSSGAADVLEALGVRLDLRPEQVEQVARDAGITFCFAQTFHPSLRHAGSARREIGIPTALNLLGPLTNPAQPRFSAVGVANARMAPYIAGVFADRGRQAAIFRGNDGLDELTLSTTSHVWWVHDGSVTEHEVDPGRFGIQTAPLAALRGGDARANAQVVHDLLAGTPGPVRDAVVLNTGLALALTLVEDGEGRFGGRADLEELLAEGITRAQQSIDDGAGTRVLERWVALTRTLD